MVKNNIERKINLMVLGIVYRFERNKVIKKKMENYVKIRKLI